MSVISKAKLHWQDLHQEMLQAEKAALNFPGPPSVLRHYNSFTSFFRVRTVWEFMEAKPGDRVLIVGDAGGKDYWFLAWNDIVCDVIDVAEQSLIPKVLIWDISAPQPPFPAQTFDVIVMCDVLEHLYDDVSALANIRFMLKDSGRLILSGPYWHDAPDHHVRIHSPRIIERMLRHHGFKIEKITSRGFMVNFYRVLHPVFLLSHYLAYRLTGRARIIDFNIALFQAVKPLQAMDFVPYLDRIIFGQRGGLNGYVLRAGKHDDAVYDHVSANREVFKNSGT
jgi:SAM-dependent methyltransferase